MTNIVVHIKIYSYYYVFYMKLGYALEVELGNTNAATRRSPRRSSFTNMEEMKTNNDFIHMMLFVDPHRIIFEQY